jgi:hypothetical protein
MEGSYSIFVRLRSLHLCHVAAELNGLSTMVGDISSTYLEAYTKEWYASLLALSMEYLKDTLSLSKMHYMVYVHQAQAGINYSQTL